MKAMIFAAGLGTRLKPLTDTMPKALIPICGKPMLAHVIAKLKAAGFSQIVINVHHFANQITEFIGANNNFDVEIFISDETNALLDTGGGIKHAADFLNDGKPFLIHNVDIASNVDLRGIYDAHIRSNAFATLLASERKTSRYLMFNNENRLCGWKNIDTNEIKWRSKTSNPDECKLLAFGGIHVVSSEIFKNFGTFEGKFSIIDLYLSLAETQNIQAYTPKNLKLIDIGKFDSLKQAETEFADLLQT